MRPLARSRQGVVWVLCIWTFSLTTLGCAGSRPALDDPAPGALTAVRPAETVAGELRDVLAAPPGERHDASVPRLLDEYIAGAFEATPDSALLWRGFRAVLVGADDDASGDGAARRDRHLALSELLYADAPPVDVDKEARVVRALAWWVEQQNAPASGRNARLVTHLARVAEARAKYPSRTRPSGLDARGETHVRYGSPSRVRSVMFNEPALLRQFFADGLPVRTSDFPGNEFWVYDEFGQAGMFLFVEGPRGGGYAHGTVNDLLPRQLRARGVSGSARGNAFALASLRSLRYIFSQLALFHPAYSARYDVISQYANWQEEQVIGQRAGRGQSAPAGYDGLTRTLEAALARNDRDDQWIGERRAELPVESARIDRARMPVVWRVARRLAVDGTPVASVYWRLLPEGAVMCERGAGATPGAHRTRIVAYAPGFATETTALDSTFARGPWDQLRHHAIPIGGAAGGLALQADAWGGSYLGACSAVTQTGPLEPLAFNASGFAVSDFIPFEVRDLVGMQEQLAAADFSADAVPAFLGASLAGLAGLGVYFEVYAQSDLADAYVLEYEVRERRRGGLFRRGQARASVFQGRRTVIDRRLPAAFLIDRSEWEGADEVEVVLTVTNLETGEAEERRMTIPTGETAR